MSQMMLIFLLLFAPQDDRDEDKIGSKKAPSIVKKAVKESLKQMGCEFQEEMRVQGPQDQTTKFSGQLRMKKYFAAAKGTAEVYAKKGRYLVASGGRYLPPDKLKGETGARAATFRNPILFLLEARGISRTASWGNDEEVDGISCKVADMTANPAILKQQIKEFADNVAGELKRYGIGNISSYIDMKQSSSEYKVYIGKKDLIIRRLDWKLNLVIKKGAIPPGVPVDIPESLQVSMDIFLRNWGDDLTLVLPAIIRKWSGVKD